MHQEESGESMRRKKNEKYCLGLATPRERCLSCPHSVCMFERLSKGRADKYIIKKTIIQKMDGKQVVSYILTWQPGARVQGTKDIKKALKLSEAEAHRAIEDAEKLTKRETIFEIIKVV